MAKLYNMQRVQGVVIVPEGTRLFNNRPVIGIRDVGAEIAFAGNQCVLGIEVVTAGAGVYNDLPVLGAVQISDQRSLYGNAPVIPVNRLISPLTILGADLLAWWTADDLSSMDLVGAQISAWRDKVTGKTVSQSVSSARPVYSAVGFNGAPCLTFDGTDDVLLNAGNHGLPQATTPGEIWALVDQQAAPGTGTVGVVTLTGITSAKRRFINRMATAGANRAEIRVGNGGSEAIIPETSADFTGRHRLRGSFMAASAEIGIDDARATGAVTLNTAGLTGVSIGATTTPSSFWLGGIRDVLYTNPLSIDQAAALAAWLDPRRNI